MNNRLHSYETSPEKTGICEYAKQGVCKITGQDGKPNKICLAYLESAVDSEQVRAICIAASDIYFSGIEKYDTSIQQLILWNLLEKA